MTVCLLRIPPACARVRRGIPSPKAYRYTGGSPASAPLIFEGGTLAAPRHTAQAAYRTVFANFEGTVSGAFGNVADSLRALERDTMALDAPGARVQATRNGCTLARNQHQAGSLDHRSLLTSDVRYQSSRIAYVTAETRRNTDTHARYIALGGVTIDTAARAFDVLEN